MPYTIRLSDGTVFASIADHAIDTSTLPIALVGRGAINYGTNFADNFVYLLENFNAVSPPNNPLVGQLWFDRGSGKMRYYVGQWLEIAQGTPSPVNLPNTIVQRDGNGNFSANIITANLSGIADSSRRWTSPRTLNLSGDATGNVQFDGSGNVTLPVTVNHSTTADRWTTARTLTLAGAITGNVQIDGSGNITLYTSYNASGGTGSSGVIGITVSHASASDTATNAQTALVAQSATNATHALVADSATHATSSDTATSAGYAGSAGMLATPRSISVSGAVQGSANFDGTANINIVTSATAAGPGAGAYVPLGMIAPIACVNAPAGYLPLTGGVLSRTTYSALWSFVQSSGMLTDEGTWAAGYFGYFTTGDGSSNFRLPDLRGTFIRAFDGGRGLDPDRGAGLLGWLQRDQLRNHIHPTAHGAQYFITIYAAAGPANIVYNNDGTVPTTYGYDYLVANGGGSETRPVNITYNYYIRAY